MTEISGNEIGTRGGRIVTTPPKKTLPPEIQKEMEKEHVVQRAPMEQAVTRHNREQMEIENFDLAIDPFRGVDFKPKKPKPGEEIEYHRFSNAFFCIRPNVAMAALRSDSIMRCCTEPFFIVKGASAREGMTREVLPTALFDLYTFLQDFEPVNGVSTAELQALCEMDKDHLNEVRIEPEKQPTIQDLISGLTAALKTNQKTATT